MAISDLDELRRRMRAVERPGIARAETSVRRRWKNHASARLEQVFGDEATRALAAEFEVDEAAIRRALNGAEAGISLPWIVEAMLERRPDLLARYVRSLLDDLE